MDRIRVQRFEEGVGFQVETDNLLYLLTVTQMWFAVLDGSSGCQVLQCLS